MDLELTDEQTWLARVRWSTLLERERPDGGVAARWSSSARCRSAGEEGLGAVELCLVARALGAHLASTPLPRQRRAALRRAGARSRAGGERRGRAARAGRRLVGARPCRRELVGGALRGRKVAVEHGGAVDRLAVVALVDGEPGVGPGDGRARSLAQPPFDAVGPDGRGRARWRRGGGPWPVARRCARLGVVGGAAREPRRRSARPGASSRTPAPTRPSARQFGRTIGSLPGAAPPAGRHVRHATRARGRRSSTRPRRSTTASTTPGGPRRSRRPTSRAPRARSRTARCRSSAGSRSPRSTRRTATCAGSSSASSSSATPRHHERALGRRLARVASRASVR